MIAIRDQHISKLQEEIAEKHSKIEELEKQALAT
jgi:predicted RNase H-like nuclease (RuvC/YqgF family)